MTTGAHRGELCSLKREDVDLDTGTLFVRTGLKLVAGQLVRSTTKTHQQRRIALDEGTVEILREHLERQDSRASRPARLGPGRLRLHPVSRRLDAPGPRHGNPALRPHGQAPGHPHDVEQAPPTAQQS